MFNIGPLEFVVLACVALLVFGPDKLPQLTKDAVRMLRTIRDMAQGARSQLTSELGPEFSNFDLNSLNPKTAIRNAIMGDDDDFSSLNPSLLLQKALRGEDENDAVADPDNAPTYSTSLDDEPAVDLTKDSPVGDAAAPGPSVELTKPSAVTSSYDDIT